MTIYKIRNFKICKICYFSNLHNLKNLMILKIVRCGKFLKFFELKLIRIFQIENFWSFKIANFSNFPNWKFLESSKWDISWIFQFIILSLRLFKLFERSKYMIIHKIENLWNFDSFPNCKVWKTYYFSKLNNFKNLMFKIVRFGKFFQFSKLEIFRIS